MSRKAKIERKTTETDISLKLEVDGKGVYAVSTGIPFLDHMLQLMTKHGFFDLDIKAKGDLEVDIHHTNEDVGIAFGQALSKALGDKKGIRRYGASYVPMEEALARVVLDISNRPAIFVNLPEDLKAPKDCAYDYNDLMSFLKAFSLNAGINLHIDIIRGEDLHHSFEAVFKSMGRALDMATQIEPRSTDIPSTKGIL